MALEMELGEFMPEGVVEITNRGNEEWDRISTIIQSVLQGKKRHV